MSRPDVYMVLDDGGHPTRMARGTLWNAGKAGTVFATRAQAKAALRRTEAFAIENGLTLMWVTRRWRILRLVPDTGSRLGNKAASR